jgi:hypothetical protein
VVELRACVQMRFDFHKRQNAKMTPVGRFLATLFSSGLHLCLRASSNTPSRLDSLTSTAMATATMNNSPITQVSQTPVQTNLQPQLLTRLLLDLRGKRFSVDRDTIMNLPESVLLCLFPNGLVLSRQSQALSDGGDNDDYEELYGVDVRVSAVPSASRSLTCIPSVRPRLLLICLSVLSKGLGGFLRDTELSRSAGRTANLLGGWRRRVSDVRLWISVSESTPHQASDHRSS